MLAKIIELKQKRANVVDNMRKMLDDAEKRDGGMTQEDEAQYDKYNTEVDKLGKDIERFERQLDLDKTLEQRDGSPAARGNEVGGGDGKQDKQAEYRSVFNEFLKSGTEALTPEQRALMAEHRALSASTGAAGGFTVPQGFYNSLIESMKAFGGMRQSRATILRTAQGNPLPIPKVDDTMNVGAILAENTAAGTQDVAFTQQTLGAYKYTSKVVLVPIELIQDSAFNIEQFLVKVLTTRIGRITNTHFTVGTGTAQPQGIVTGSTLGKTGATGQTTSVVYDDLIDLIHAVDIAYRDQAQFMMHDTSLKAFKKLKDTQGRPLWLPGIAVNEPDTINGYKYVINNDVPVMAASAKSLLFGDFSAYMIRDVMDVQIVRMGEKYADSAQVGFVAFSRHDGQLVDAGAHPIVYYANSAT